MGYRSDGILAFTKEALMNAHLAGVAMDPDWFDEFKSKEETIYCFFDSWKWNDSSEKVNKITKFMDFLDEITKNTPLYGFLLIGESFADIQYRGDCYEFDISVGRVINAPFERDSICL